MAVAAHIEPARLAATRPMLSVVLPAHDEAGVIDATLTRIAALDPELTERIEVIVVSDGSTDATFEDACEGLGRGLEGRVVELAANVGAHAAICCGLRYARGDLVALMSADGQDPPEALPAMLERFSPELDVVWGWRRERRNDGGSARFAAAAFYRFFRLLTGLDYPPSGLDFLIVRRRVIDAVLQHSTRNTSLHLLIYNLGSRRRSWSTTAAREWADTRAGRGASASSSPSTCSRVARRRRSESRRCRHPGRAGGLALGGVTLVRAAFGAVPASGWASLMVVSSFMGGLMLVAIAFLGEYVWRILDEVRGAPPFIEARHEHASRGGRGEERGGGGGGLGERGRERKVRWGGG